MITYRLNRNLMKKSIFTRIFFGSLLFLMSTTLLTQTPVPVKVWEDVLVLPTYVVEKPETNPMFFRHQSYQGASRVIYPYALQDQMTNQKVNKKYRALYLENEYIKLCVLPEIGGRLFYATDKTNGYEIFYRQHVIKPANIGMLGAWISGGIEFCVFHHHRASTFLPVNYKISSNSDGSATIWIGETEPRHRMKWTLGISLYPGKSYIEVNGRLINATENVNSILYWANVATHVDSDYQIIFPPSTDFATFHAKNSFSHWPVTTETYRGLTWYQDSIDASWWKNHPEPISFFAHNLKNGFLAGYDYGKQAGTMHVANPHIVKGAKLWEWGPGAYGSMWDSKVLTDNDGPYAELMAGAYSDNQPDYSWIKPYENKTFKQFWYPIRNSEGASNANLQGMVNLKQLDDRKLYIAANSTCNREKAQILLKDRENILFNKQIHIAPDRPFYEAVPMKEGIDFYNLVLTLTDSAGGEIVSYHPKQKIKNLPLPETVKPPVKPEEIGSIEELYLTGLRIKQFHNARIDPLIYFQEALKRDSLDTRCNTQMGIDAKEKGLYDEAARYFRRGLRRLTKDYTHPRNCEAFYHLGVILKMQEKYDAAYDTLYRAAWDQSFASAAYYQLAQISVRHQDFQRALEEVDRSLDDNMTNLEALLLKSAILRHLGKNVNAIEAADIVLALDVLNFTALFEKFLSSKDSSVADGLKSLMQDTPESYLEVAAIYLQAGLLDEARQILSLAVSSKQKKVSEYPTIYYYCGYICHQQGQKEAAQKHFKMAAEQPTDYCFPYRLESEKIFLTALADNPDDAKAYYYLGNLLYDKQPERAITYWEKAVTIDSDLAVAQRNIGWGYNQIYHDIPGAITAYETAIDKDPTQAVYYFELDKLYELNGTPPEKRYELLVNNHNYLIKRSNALIEEIKVLLLVGEYDKAISYLQDNYFPRQEDIDDIHDIYVDAWLLKGLNALKDKVFSEASDDFQKADFYPENHMIGRDVNYGRNAQIFYYQALAMEKNGMTGEANKRFGQAADVQTRNPEYQYYKALALIELGRKKAANDLLDKINTAGKERLEGKTTVDFFSKFGEGEAGRFRMAEGHYLCALASLGKGKVSSAKKSLAEAVTLNPNHLWASELLKELE